MVVAASLILMALPWTAAWRTKRTSLACGAALLLSAAAIGGPYILTTGSFTNKPTPRKMLRPTSPPDTHGQQAAAPGRISSASLLAVYCPDGMTDRKLWGLKAIGSELAKALQYVLVVPLILGLFWFRKRWAEEPGAWVISAFCVLHMAVLWRLATVVGYVSERHVLILVLCAVPIAAAGLAALGNGLLNHQPSWSAWFRYPGLSGRNSYLTSALLAAIAE